MHETVNRGMKNIKYMKYHSKLIYQLLLQTAAEK